MSVNLSPPQSFYDAVWTQGIEPEILSFLTRLNWFYIIMFINILYGLKHTGLFYWYTKFLNHSKLRFSKTWITAIIVAIVFISFRAADSTLDVTVDYVSRLSISVVVSVIFSRVLVDIPGFAIKRLTNFLDTEDRKNEDKEEKKG